MIIHLPISLTLQMYKNYRHLKSLFKIINHCNHRTLKIAMEAHRLLIHLKILKKVGILSKNQKMNLMLITARMKMKIIVIKIVVKSTNKTPNHLKMSKEMILIEITMSIVDNILMMTHLMDWDLENTD